MTIQDIDLDLVGDGALFNQIFDAFKGVVIDVLNVYLPDAISDTISKVMQQLSQSNCGYAYFGDHSFCQDNRIPPGMLSTTASTMSMPQVGTIWAVDDKGALPTRRSEPMPSFIGNADYQQLNSPATLESMFNAHAESGYYTANVTHDSVPPTFQSLMTTSYFKTSMPDLYADYPDMPLSLSIVYDPAQEGYVYPKVDIMPSGIKATGSFPISVGIQDGPQDLVILDATYE
ncbi:hypothetical protein KIPB_009809, partial [Kipferlia bialata]|eukprot:g9809.t1